jgi:hypothetical protein
MPKRRQTVYAPPLPPAAATDATGGLMALTEAYRNMIAQMRLNKASVTTGFKAAREDIKQALQQNLVDVESQAIGTGTLGDSTDIQRRVVARADALRAIQEARGQKVSGLQGLALTKQQGETTLQTGLAQLQASVAAQQAQQGIDEFASGTQPGIGGAGGGGGGPGGNQPARQASPDLVRLNDLVNQIMFDLNNAQPGTDRHRVLAMQLDRVWTRRNRLRARLGLQTVPTPKPQGGRGGRT